MSEQIRSLRFAFLLCLICSLALTSASVGLRSFQEENIHLDKERNVLKAMGLLKPDAPLTPEAVRKLYQEKIRSVWIDSNGIIQLEAAPGQTNLPIYLYVDQNRIKGYILPINSNGLWGKINGYMALENDGSTIAGFTVYQHSETPGLGGEIEKAWFQKNFVGKKIVDENGHFVAIHIVKGQVADALPLEKRINAVDGISGATLTGKFLSQGFKETLTEYEPVSIRFRHHQVPALPALGKAQTDG